MPEQKTKNKLEKFYYNGLSIEKEVKNNEPMNEEFVIKTCGKEYCCNIKYNEDRGKWQAIINFNARKNSLSFFDVKKQANEMIMMWISYNNNVPVNTSNRIGD